MRKFEQLSYEELNMLYDCVQYCWYHDVETEPLLTPLRDELRCEVEIRG